MNLFGRILDTSIAVCWIVPAVLIARLLLKKAGYADLYDPFAKISPTMPEDLFPVIKWDITDDIRPKPGR